MPDGFLLKSVVFKLISKEISRAEHEYMKYTPSPTPQLTLWLNYWPCRAGVYLRGERSWGVRVWHCGFVVHA